MGVMILSTMYKKGVEDLKHFLFTCNSLEYIRVAEFKSLENQLIANHLESIWNVFISSDLNVKTCFLLGLSKNLFVDVVNIDHDVNCALNIFDQACKSFLKRAWCLRNEIVNTCTGIPWNIFAALRIILSILLSCKIIYNNHCCINFVLFAKTLHLSHLIQLCNLSQWVLQ